MVALGCTICRGCQLDTCHVGIATQIEDKAEADLKGLKKFTPQAFEEASENCARFFVAMGEEVRDITAELGYERTQDLVGRSDLLVQAHGAANVDVHELIKPIDEMLDLEPLDLPGPEDDREAAGLIAARPIRMKAKEGSAKLAALAGGIETGRVLEEDWDGATDSHDRVLGTELAGEIARGRIFEGAAPGSEDTLARLRFNSGSVGGQGLGAFNVYGVDITVEGGAQDGVAKGMLGGKIAVMKGQNRLGKRVNGSVGKSFAYGAQRGRLFVQGDADSRFCIRLSGADVVIAGEPQQPLDDSQGCVADRANIKGFAFEYMTAGRAVVLGDPGPWFCAGQTGGRVYLRVNDDWNLDREALEHRRGKGAKVALEELDAEGVLDVQELLGHYAEELRGTGQDEEAERITALADQAQGNFLMSVPEAGQTDPSVSTE
jgi:glutamate synthase (NADPH/NADH) large chain